MNFVQTDCIKLLFFLHLDLILKVDLIAVKHCQPCRLSLSHLNLEFWQKRGLSRQKIELVCQLCCLQVAVLTELQFQIPSLFCQLYSYLRLMLQLKLLHLHFFHQSRRQFQLVLSHLQILFLPSQAMDVS